MEVGVDRKKVEERESVMRMSQLADIVINILAVAPQYNGL